MSANLCGISLAKRRTVKKSRFSEAQIIAVLKEHETGVKTADLCRKHGISSATLYAWKSKFGGLEISDIAKMRALEDENRRRSSAQYRCA
jgi:putative transposase